MKLQLEEFYFDWYDSLVRLLGPGVLSSDRYDNPTSHFVNNVTKHLQTFAKYGAIFYTSLIVLTIVPVFIISRKKVRFSDSVKVSYY